VVPEQSIPATSVFLSHSSVDKDFARKLTADLQRHGVEVWIDEAGLLPGDEWRDRLDGAIASVDYVLVVVSPTSVRAKWVRYELQQARRLGIRMVPVMNLSTKLPALLADLQVVDMTTGPAYRRGLERIVALFAQSWVIPRHTPKPWTKRGLTLAKRGGLVELADGRIEFTRRVAESLRTHAGRWMRGLPPYGGSEVFTAWREYSGVSVLHSFAPSSPLTPEQEIVAATEAHDHLLYFLLDIAVRGGIMDETADVLSLDADLGAEMESSLTQVAEYGFLDDNPDPYAAATIMFVELIRIRLLDRIPQMASFAEPLGTVIHDMFGFWPRADSAAPSAKTAKPRRAPATRRRKDADNRRYGTVPSPTGALALYSLGARRWSKVPTPSPRG
jgi:hypothetical protein